jgi:hypothetical protein
MARPRTTRSFWWRVFDTIPGYIGIPVFLFALGAAGLQLLRHTPRARVVSCSNYYCLHGNLWAKIRLDDGDSADLDASWIRPKRTCLSPGTTFEKRRGELGYLIDDQPVDAAKWGYRVGVAVGAVLSLVALGRAAWRT